MASTAASGTLELMLRRWTVLATSSVFASVLVIMLLVGQVASAAGRAEPSRFRYAGVVADGRGIPTHYLTRGGGAVFYFFDALSRGRKSTSYQLCIGPPAKAPVRCWNRRARYGVGRVAFSFTLPINVPLGELIALWRVRDRAVASWRFLYVRGEGETEDVAPEA